MLSRLLLLLTSSVALAVFAPPPTALSVHDTSIHVALSSAFPRTSLPPVSMACRASGSESIHVEFVRNLHEPVLLTQVKKNVWKPFSSKYNPCITQFTPLPSETRMTTAHKTSLTRKEITSL